MCEISIHYHPFIIRWVVVYDTIRYDTTRHDTTRHDTTRHDIFIQQQAYTSIKMCIYVINKIDICSLSEQCNCNIFSTCIMIIILVNNKSIRYFCEPYSMSERGLVSDKLSCMQNVHHIGPYYILLLILRNLFKKRGFNLTKTVIHDALTQ